MSTTIIAKPSSKVKPRVIVDADGIIYHRTKLLTLTVATNFARCQRANKRFENAIVVQSRAANPPKNFYVRYLPANPERQIALAGNEEQKRIDRAKNAEFQFFADPDNANLVYCLSDSGEVYELRRREGAFVNCSCPDSTVGIARRLLIPCKHRIAAAEQVPEARQVESAEDRKARILREREECYGGLT